MISIKNVKVFNIDGAIRGMRKLASWRCCEYLLCHKGGVIGLKKKEGKSNAAFNKVFLF